MLAPAWDQGWLTSASHGTAAQRPTMVAAMEYCRQRRCALDLGAHIGIWAVELAKYFGSVIAVEPNVENRACLSANTAEIPNIAVIPVAVSDRQGVTSLAKTTNIGTWYMVPGEETRVITIDDMGLEELDLVKMDVEGMEGPAMKGGYNTLSQCRPVIVWENKPRLRERYPDAADPYKWLNKLGYVQRAKFRNDEIWTPRA